MHNFTWDGFFDLSFDDFREIIPSEFEDKYKEFKQKFSISLCDGLNALKADVPFQKKKKICNVENKENESTSSNGVVT